MQLINKLYKENELKILVLNNEMLMDPMEVGKCLDMTQSTVWNHLAKMTEKQAVLVKASDYGLTATFKISNSGKKFITESGVYRLILSSRKPSAQSFKNWLCDEVLPDIRKNGMYIIDGIIVKLEQLKTLTDENLKSSKIYFIEDGRGYVKIGVSLDVDARLKSLQTGNSQTLSLVGTVRGSYDQEAYWHARFSDQHHRGEWFRIEDKLETFLDILRIR